MHCQRCERQTLTFLSRHLVQERSCRGGGFFFDPFFDELGVEECTSQGVEAACWLAMSQSWKLTLLRPSDGV